jgi:hypothetical protein
MFIHSCYQFSRSAQLLADAEEAAAAAAGGLGQATAADRYIHSVLLLLDKIINN